MTPSPPEIHALVLSVMDGAVPANPNHDQVNVEGKERPIWEGLPVSLFGSVMGMTGLSIAWGMMSAQLGTPSWIADLLACCAALVFVILVFGYTMKILRSPGAVRAEFLHPIQGNLFGTFIISVLLLPIVIAPVSLWFARAGWTLGAVLMLGFAWVIVTRWMSERQLAAHATPAWIVPVVGALEIPLALPHLSLPELHAVMVVGLSIGLFFTIPLFTLIFSRLIFEDPLPTALEPTLLILIGPFALGFTSYVATTGMVDLFAEGLYVLMLFLLGVLLPRLAHLPQCCPFRFSWWSVSFPLAASANAALIFAKARPSGLTQAVAFALLALASVVMAYLLWLTLAGVARGDLRTLSR